LSLQKQGISPLLVYSKEGSDSLESFSKTETEISECIRAATAFQKPAFVAIKLSGLAPETELRQLERQIHNITSARQGASSRDILTRATQALHQFPDLWGRVQRLSAVAKESDVQLVLDAEIRFQGDIDALPTSALLCSILNQTGTKIWNTHQM